jgi:hypothetical protein
MPVPWALEVVIAKLVKVHHQELRLSKHSLYSHGMLDLE